MSKIIQISDKKNGVLSFDLSDLLRLMPATFQQLVWSILDLSQFIQNPESVYVSGKEMVAISKKAHDSLGGYILPWDDLVKHAAAMRQVGDGLFIGCHNVGDLSTFSFKNPDKELYEKAEVVVEAFDSSCWIVYSRDDEYISRLRATFHDVKELKLPSE